ncbi:MAG: redoxin domain-containing protein [Blastocatellia bacterium]|nr:redoxin domain-containing protein [Blastocatellia bacterium]
MTRFFLHRTGAAALLGLFVFLLSLNVSAQQNGGSTSAARPTIKQISEVELLDLIKPKGKPLLINFWATWCIPCREEFPELVILDDEFRGKIDFITITLDDIEEIDRLVPRFLSEVKAQMPTFLLYSAKEDAAIRSVSAEWRGALPFTILYAPSGEAAYSRQGLIKLDTVRSEIERVLVPAEVKP